jgi:hypothetical protein
MAAFIHEIEMDRIGKPLPGPPFRSLEKLLWKYTATDRKADRFTVNYTADKAFPVEPRRGDASVGQLI